MNKLLLIAFFSATMLFSPASFADLLPKTVNLNEDFYDTLSHKNAMLHDGESEKLYYFKAKEGDIVTISLSVDLKKDYFIPGMRIFQPAFLQSPKDYLDEKDITEIQGFADFIIKNNRKKLELLTPDVAQDEELLEMNITFKNARDGKYMLMILGSCEHKKDSKRCNKGVLKRADGQFGSFKLRITAD